MTKSVSRYISNSIPIYSELLEFIPKNQLKIFLTSLDKSDPALFRFSEGLINNKWKNDLQARKEIVGESDTKKYNRLKENLRNKILDKIVNISVSPSTSNDEAFSIYKKLNQQFVAYNLLKSKYYSASAAYIGELMVARSIKHGISDFIPKVSSDLIEYYCIANLDQEKADYYSNILHQHSNIIEWEYKAKIAYAKLVKHYNLVETPSIKAISIAEDFLEKAAGHEGKINSPKFHARFYLIQTFYFYSKRDFKSMDAFANKGVVYFRSLPVKQPSSENLFLKKRIEANLILGDFELCQKLSLELLKQTAAKKSNWYNTLVILVKLNLHQGDYTQAIRFFNSGHKNRYHGSLTETSKNRWGLLEAYINFLQLSGAVPETPTMSRYRINKFINDTPEYTADKKGKNIQLIIAQLLFYILDKNWDRIEEKIDALQQYGSRYLRRGELFRSRVFIKMLSEIPRQLYHKQAIIRHTNKYKKRLAEVTANIDVGGNTMEIIPYEDLWDLIIQNIVAPKKRKSK